MTFRRHLVAIIKCELIQINIKVVQFSYILA